jgi:hypothetical protein
VNGVNVTIAGFAFKVCNAPSKRSRHLGKNVSELV